MRGCRCDDCRQAHTDRERKRRHARSARKDQPIRRTKSDYRDIGNDSYSLAEIMEARGGSW